MRRGGLGRLHGRPGRPLPQRIRQSSGWPGGPDGRGARDGAGRCVLWLSLGVGEREVGRAVGVEEGGAGPLLRRGRGGLLIPGIAGVEKLGVGGGGLLLSQRRSDATAPRGGREAQVDENRARGLARPV